MAARKPHNTYSEVSRFIDGYQTKLQQDEVPPGCAVLGSFNFALDDDGKWVTRPGSAYFGSKSSDTGTNTSSGKLVRRDGVEIPIVHYGTKLKYFHPQKLDWRILTTGLANQVAWGFGEFDVTEDNVNKISMCNGVDNYRVWAGITGVVASFTGNTITLDGSVPLLDMGFTDSGSLSNNGTIYAYTGIQKMGTVASVTANTIVINGATIATRGFDSPAGVLVVDGITFNYTGTAGNTFTGVTPNPVTNNVVANDIVRQSGGSETFVGVTPDPTVTGMASGDGIAQTPIEYPSAPKGSILVTAPNARIIEADVVTNNSLYGGGGVYGSKTADPTDFTFSIPRLADQGFALNVAEGGGTITGLGQFEKTILIFKRNTIYILSFSTDGNDTPALQPLLPHDSRTSGDEGSVAPMAVFKLGQMFFFVSPTNVINTIQRVQQYDYPLPLAISDPIKKTVDALTFDVQTAGIGWRGRAYTSCKSAAIVTLNDTQLVYNQRYQAWETPMVGLPIASYFTYGGNLYGCLANSPDVVQMWTGTRDLFSADGDFPINAKLILPRLNYGTKADRKEFDTFYIEGEMFQTGSATVSIQYDENGTTRSGTIQGTEEGFFFKPAAIGGFGSEEFGIDTFGPSGSGVIPSTEPVKFRLYFKTKGKPFWNMQPTITTASWFKLLSFGPSVIKTQFVTPASFNKKLA